MVIYKRLVFPLLRQFDAEQVHDASIRSLSFSAKTEIGRRFIGRIAGEIPRRPVSVFGLNFSNELGVAAGFDKSAQIPIELGMLGFGHVEVGTLTPRPQRGNPRPRVFRLLENKAIINQMGFPNCGSVEASIRLLKIADAKGDLIIGVSLGKQKETPLAEAIDDYSRAITDVYAAADYLAVNVSSPNTPELRELQHAYLRDLLASLRSEGLRLATQLGITERPILLKIAPDLAWAELDLILMTASEEGVKGIIATNTTIDKSSLSQPASQLAGGLSGKPLSKRSNQIISYIWKETQGKMPVIGVGGIFTAQDVKEKLDAGAVLVQVYTGLVYEGPGMPGRVLRELESQSK